MKLKVKYDDSDTRDFLKKIGWSEEAIDHYCKAQRQFLKKYCAGLDAAYTSV